MPDILTENQRKFLHVFGRNDSLRGHFYLTGGTALAGFYLHHRYSEDLDFFSLEEVDPMIINVFLKTNEKELGVTKVDYEQSYNRNLFYLTIGEETVKTEFTYFPFPQVEPPTLHQGVRVDSLIDIAANKLFAIYQRSVARDYIDLYMICKEKGWTVHDLIAKARIKFDWHIDPLQLGSQFYKAGQAVDMPRMIAPIESDAWQSFFVGEAEKLKEDVLRDAHAS